MVFICFVSPVASSVPKTWKKPKEDALVEQAQCSDREVSVGCIVGPALWWVLKKKKLFKFVYNFTD